MYFKADIERSPLLSPNSRSSSEAFLYGGMATQASHHAVVASGEETLSIYGYRTTRLRTVTSFSAVFHLIV